MDGEDGGDGGGFMGGGGMGGIQSLGIVNALKTGDMHTDLLIAMCIPLVLRILFSNMEKIGNVLSDTNNWRTWFNKQRGYKERFLVSKSMVDTDRWSGSGGSKSLDGDTQNAVLIKAIELYMNSQCDLKLDHAYLDLTSSNTPDNNNSSSGYYSDDDDNKNGDTTIVGRLSKYKMVKKPMEHIWINLGLFGSEKPYQMVQMMIKKSEDTVGGRDNAVQREIKTYHLRSLGATSIDDFLKKAYDWYIDELRKLEDNARHLYELQKSKSSSSSNDDGGGGGGSGSFTFKRYRLSNEKTFQSLFFKEKDTILKIMSHFLNKTGKYSIAGYPHKLGLLLHGPPGTGKTSLIKALANHTGRSIVNVPLAKIETNTELMSIFFDQSYHIQGEYIPIKLGFKDVIFVLEDVDAASNVVKRRDGRTTSEVVQTEQIELPPSKSLWRLLLESNDDYCKDVVNQLIEKSDRLKKEACNPDLVMALADRVNSLPGLSLVGSLDTNLSQLGDETLESAQKMTECQEQLDRFLSGQIKPLLALLERGGEISDELVDALLAVPGSSDGSPSYAELEKPRPQRGSIQVSHATTAAGGAAAMAGGIDPSLQLLLGLLPDAADGGAGTKTAGTDAETGKAGSGDGGGGGGAPQGPMPLTSVAAASGFSFGKDRLNLTGILNVLDGVVDSPGRMVIMTTNHPEMLDPALIRPGRIDKKLLLGYMRSIDVIHMIEHYFQTELGPNEKNRVKEAIKGNMLLGRPHVNLTPAQVEQLAAEHDEVEDMVCALEEKGMVPMSDPSIPKPRGGTRATSKTIAFDV